MVAQLAGVRLTHLDQLVDQPAAANADVASAELVVTQVFEQFEKWQRDRAAAPLIAALVRKAQEQRFPPTVFEKRRLHLRIMELKLHAAELAELAA
jgi:glutamyl-tRNA reductase